MTRKRKPCRCDAARAENIRGILEAMTVCAQSSQRIHDDLEQKSWALAFQNVGFAAAILIAPLAFAVGGLLDPVIHVTNGTANITAIAVADPLTNELHLAASCSLRSCCRSVSSASPDWP